ncbi:hypothetical protein [Chromohalobacter japonicus]|uniref:hypothetical protein n=1 Tax=Chromohalobacter japonicus TaxID=223900 RepID=UPI00058F7FE0|nr:hypothetical protein [Chromohalobacter japonicus]
MTAAADDVAETLARVARQLAAGETVAPCKDTLTRHAGLLEASAAEETCDERRLLQSQLALISRQLVAVSEAAGRLSIQASRE